MVCFDTIVLRLGEIVLLPLFLLLNFGSLFWRFFNHGLRSRLGPFNRFIKLFNGIILIIIGDILSHLSQLLLDLEPVLILSDDTPLSHKLTVLMIEDHSHGVL